MRNICKDFIFASRKIEDIAKLRESSVIAKNNFTVFFLLIHTENSFFVGTGIRESETPQNPRKFVSNEN